MEDIRTFFRWRNLQKFLVFAAVVAIPLAGKHTYDRGIPFLSGKAGQVYLSFVAVSYVVILLVFFLLFLAGRKKR